MNSNAHKLSTEQTDTALLDASRHSLAALPYLSISSFKSPTTLSLALDSLAHQLHATKPNAYHHAEQSFQVNLAECIVTTLVNANFDYASKLDLITCAANHRIFKPQYSLWQLAAAFAKLIPLIGNYISEQPGDAELILAAGKTTLITSRSKIILG